jgi:hypothetical protein
MVQSIKATDARADDHGVKLKGRCVFWLGHRAALTLERAFARRSYRFFSFRNL